jgi:hypothetical protein
VQRTAACSVSRACGIGGRTRRPASI